jgi:outer membrane receptor protein involved in Fe transport
VQANLDFEKFSLQVSNRLDYHSEYGVKNNPRIAGIFNPKGNWKIWASFGTAYRAPSPYYAYSSLAYPVDGGIFYSVVPNPDLDPEELMSAEGGIRWKAYQNFSLSLQAFYHVLEKNITRSINLLDPDKYPDDVSGPLVDIYENDSLSQARLFGVKLNASIDNLVESIGFDIDMHLQYTAGSETLPNNLGELDAYRMSPPFMGQLNLSVNPWGKLYINIRNILTSSWYKRYLPLSIDVLESIGYPTKVDGYYTMDLVASYSFSRNLQAFLQVFNVFDAEYGGLGAYGSEYDLLYNPQYGRSFKLGFSFRLE